MRSMRSMVVAVVLVAMVLAGCGSGGSGGLVRAAGSSPTASASEPPPVDRAEMAAQARKLLMAQEALLDIAGPTRAQDTLDGDFVTSYYCNMYASNEGRTGHVAHERRWYTAHYSVAQVAHTYYRKSGAEAVREARAGVQRRCSEYAVTYGKTHTDDRANPGDNVRYQLLGPVAFDKPGGVEDAFAACEQETQLSGKQWVVCGAYLGRKNLVSAVFVTAGLDEAATKATLLQIIPKAATALVAASR